MATIYLNSIRLFCMILFLVALGCKNDDDAAETPDTGESVVMHQSESTIFFSYLQNVPSGEVSEEKPIYTIPNAFILQGLSLAPDGKRGAIALFSSEGSSRSWEGLVKIYNTSDGSLAKEYMKEGLRNIAGFPIVDASMFFIDMQWMDDTLLLLHMQPQAPWIESVPQNISLVIDIDKDKQVDRQYSPRNSPFTIRAPEHESKNKFITEIINGTLHIAGEPVSNLRSLSVFDVYFK